MTDIMNPYIAGAPVTEARMFFGREDVFDWIEKSLGGQYADHILVVHGQRRVGKTSVLKQLGNRLPEKYIPVFFDLQGRTHTTLHHFLWWLARETARVLKQERGIEIPSPDKDDFARDPEFFENVFLPGLQPVLGGTSLLFTFDEFDNLEESDVREELARPLTDYLRRLMGRGEINFIYSIGSSGRKLENMQAAYTEFFKTALYKKISFLSREQTHGLVTRPVEGVIEYDSAAVERIYTIACGHPYFTQLTCHELFARCQRTGQRSIALADVDAILDDVVERGTVNLKFVWDEASDIEKWSLAALAQLEKGENRLLADYLGKQRVRFSESDLTSALLHLREKDVLTPANGFVIHLLRLWLQKNRPIEQVREELTEANPIANRYIEIGQEFKDAGQFDKAIESFRDALNISANNLQAQVNIALAYAAQGQLEQAVIEFEKALAIDDEDVTSRAGMCDAHLALGDAAMKKGKTKEAVLSYQRVLEINAEHLEARQRMAELSRQRAEKALTGGRDEEALGAFSEALKFTPEDAALLVRVEKVRAEKKTRVLNAQFARSDKEAAARNWDKAILALNEALEIAPGETSILERIEKVKEKQRRGQLEAILAKVEAAEKGGRWDTAIAGLNEYLRVQPEVPAVQKRLADLLEARHAAWLSGVNARVDQAVKDREWDVALAALNEALQLEPGNAQMLAKLDQVQEKRRKAGLEDMLQRANQAVSGSRWDEAIDLLNDGLVAYPDNETLKTRLAEARKAKRDARLQSVLRLADTAVQAGRWDTATASLQEVLANEPDNTEFQDKLADLKRRERESKLSALRVQAGSLLKAEKFDEALAAWDAYLALDPEHREGAQAQIEAIKKAQNVSTLYAEASGAYAKKNYEKAIELFKRIVVEDAEYRDTTDLLAESVRLRRTGHKTSKARLRKIWVTGGLVGVLFLALGGGIFWLGKNGQLSLSTLFPAKTVTEEASALAGATITVSSREDNGPGTLRQALLDAQEGDTITFDPSVFPPGKPATIFITSGTLDIFSGYITIDASNAGVLLDGSLAGDRIAGLYIGSSNTIVMGLRIVNFGGGGIYIEGSNNRIGGDRTVGTGSLGQGNLIGNNNYGIQLLASSGNNVITGNYIGIDELGQDMGNWRYGIWIVPSDMYHILPNVIGPDNTIAYNGSKVEPSSGEPAGGIVIETVQIPTTITGNAIFDNAGPGILYNVDETARATYATPPVILEFDRESGTVEGDACSDCSVDIFSTDTSDGQYFEGTVMAGPFGHFGFEKGEALTGAFPTATLTRSDKYTSEFSQAPYDMMNIQLAWDAIQTQAPDYATSFDTWVFDDAEEQARLKGARLEDGQLIITSTGSHVSAVLETPASDMFAVQYDVFASDISDDGHCIFYSDAGAYPIIATAYHHGNMELSLSRVEGDGDSLATGTYDPSISNTVTRIVLGDQVAEFLNGRLVFGVSDPGLRASYNHSTFAVNFPITCAYDNYTYWDLSGLDLSTPAATDEPPSQPAWMTDFVEPILAYLDSNSPTFEDDFSTNLNMEAWGFTSEGEVVGSGLGGGVLGKGDSLEYGLGVHFPTNGMLDAEDFAFEFDFKTDSEMEYIGMKFWDGGDPLTINVGYSLRISNSGNWSLVQNYNDSEIQSGTAPSFLEGGFNTLLLVGQKSTIAAFLNDELLFTALDLEGYNDNNAIIFKSKEAGDGDASFDNIQFWNLEGVDFPTPDDPSSSPAWVTDFAEPILAAIAGYGPDDGMGNYIDYRTWLDASCSHPDIVLPPMAGLFVQNCNFSWKPWFTDFVIEMNARMEPVGSRDPDSGWTFHYRSLNGFTFFYDGTVQEAFGGDIEDLDALLPGSVSNKITIIVKDQEHALYINDQPIYYGTLPSGYKNGIGSWGIKDPVTFESINIWDLNEAKYGLP